MAHENNNTSKPLLMHWYDLSENLEDVMQELPKRKFSIAELAKSINAVYNNSKYANKNEYFDALNYLKKNKSDIISRLKDKLDFDIKLHEDDPMGVKFEKLQILKVVCIAEKFGEKKNKSKCYLEAHDYQDDELPEYQMPLIDIMAEPALSYVESEYADCALYQAEFDRVLNLVKINVKNAQKIEHELYELHNNWRKLITSTQYDAILTNPDNRANNISKVSSVKATLENIRSISAEDYIPLKKSVSSSLIESFYIMLLTTKIRAEIRDYHKLRKFDSEQDEFPSNKIRITVKPDEKTVLKQKYLNIYFKNAAPSETLRNQFVHDNFYKQHMTFSAFSEYIKRGKKNLRDFAENEEKKAIWRLILQKETPDVDDVTELYEPAYQFAFKYTRKIADMWYKYLISNNKKDIPFILSPETNSSNHDDGTPYPVDIWCVVFRELLYIFLKDESIDNTYRYYKNAMKTLTSAVKSNSDFEALPNMILIKHLQDRLILMYQSPDVVKYEQEIEKQILDMEEVVLRYHTMEEIHKADKALRFIVGIRSESKEFIDLVLKGPEFYYLEYDIQFISKQVQHDFLSALSRDKASRGIQNMFLYNLDKELFKLLYDALTFSGNIDNSSKFSNLLNLRMQLPKSETAAQNISDIFSKHIQTPINPEKVQYYNQSVNLCLQDKSDYTMYFTFSIDHKQKIINVTKCSFDNNI